MTQSDTTSAPVGGTRAVVRYRGRHLPMVAVVVAASIATALAYSGMVLFGLEVAGMSPAEAYALAGFLEVSLVAVALMARNAALEGRPYGVLLTLTWILSGTSGMFAALHEIAVPDASTPYMVAFRFVPPLVAALMWHLALVGERHLVTGHTLDERRRENRVHEYVTALELWRDARLDSTGTRRAMRKVRAAHRRQRSARDGALRLLTVEDFERRMQVWVERLEAAERHGNRLDRIGASSAKRGVVRGTAEDAAQAAPQERYAPVSQTWTESIQEATVVTTTNLDGATAQGEGEPAATAPFGEAFQAALVAETPTETPTERAEAEGAEVVHADVVQAEVERTHSEAPSPFEPLPETGHTRRVEVFDLVRNADPAEGRATAERSAFFVAHSAPTPAEDAAHDVAPSGEQPTSDRDRLIVELAAEGMTQREIADRVSASRTTVSRVLRRFAPTATDAGLELTPA